MKLAQISVTKEDLSFSKSIGLIAKTIWKHYRLAVIGIFIAGSISGLFQVAGPRVFQQIIDNITAAKYAELVFLSIIVGACVLGGAVFNFFAEKISFYIATQVEDRWRYSALLHFYNLPMKWQDQHDSGEIGSKLDRGGSAIFSIFYELFGQNIFVSVLTLLFVLGYAFWQFPIYAIILLLPVPLYLFVTWFISSKIVSYAKIVKKLDHVAVRTFFDGVGNLRYVKSFGKEHAETAVYAKRWSAYHEAEYKIDKVWFLQGFLQKTVESIARIVLLIIAFVSLENNTMTLGQLVMLVSYQQLTFTPLEQMTRIFTRLKRLTERSQHLFKIMTEPDTLADTHDSKPVADLKKQIVFNKVSFTYNQRTETINDMSFSILKGTTTALIGRSGAGKSTIAALLMRFYDPTNGSITWDNTDLRHVTRASLRSKMSLILQDTTLFNRSIASNIAYARPNASMQDIKKAAKLAHAHAFILALPKGYASIVGERGVRLSGGQRQRIAIARALLAQPDLLIMDEATSHLDSETELAIKEAIQYLHGKHTQVIIAHRLSTVQHADNIILLEKGKIIAQGKHEELLKHPLYKRLCKLQLHK
ncbi:MAG: ABC transporter ATP-binding protein [Candidatus Woesearchaeota archaeon]|nr:ABC transporter ATP-binding protein [Candidatus Woesearchaeota archaeon]